MIQKNFTSGHKEQIEAKFAVVGGNDSNYLNQAIDEAYCAFYVYEEWMRRYGLWQYIDMLKEEERLEDEFMTSKTEAGAQSCYIEHIFARIKEEDIRSGNQLSAVILVLQEQLKCVRVLKGIYWIYTASISGTECRLSTTF